jgi:hypothetical protein
MMMMTVKNIINFNKFLPSRINSVHGFSVCFCKYFHIKFYGYLCLKGLLL